MPYLIDDANFHVMQCSLDESRYALLMWGKGATTAEIDHLSEVITLQLRSARRAAAAREENAPDKLEYESWFQKGPPGAPLVPRFTAEDAHER